MRDAIVNGVGRGKDELQEAMVVVESRDEMRRRGEASARLPPGPPHADSRGDDQAPLFLPSPLPMDEFRMDILLFIQFLAGLHIGN